MTDQQDPSYIHPGSERPVSWSAQISRIRRQARCRFQSRARPPKPTATLKPPR